MFKSIIVQFIDDHDCEEQWRITTGDQVTIIKHCYDAAHMIAGLQEKIERLTFENERLRSGLRGIRREFGYKSINNSTSTLGGFIDMLLINDVAGAKRLKQVVSDEKRNM